MSIVSVHGPNTWGSKSIVANQSGTAYAIATNPANGLVWQFNPNDKSKPAAQYDWAYTGLTGTPATPIADTMTPTVTFSGAGSAVVTLTLNGVAQQSFTITATAGVAPKMTEEMVEVEERAETPPPPSPKAEQGQPSGDGEQGAYAEAGFDPAAHTVAEVEQYVADHPDEAEQILDLEEEGKNRTTLVSYLESVLDHE